MADPNLSRLTEAYEARQIKRTLDTLNKIVARSPISAGRVVPTAEGVAIYDGRRIDASVMFMDICKFSQRPSWTDAEQQTLLQIIALLFTEMIRIIEDHGGVVEKNTGDGLMAYFVKQSSVDVSAQQRALSAALTMFSAKDRLINPIIQQSGLQTIDFRICMDHGPITVANVGAARGFKGMVAIGATANIASKMLGFADSNEILIGTKLVQGLPSDWVVKWVKLKTSETGWVLRESDAPYSFWNYTGRWSGPIS